MEKAALLAGTVLFCLGGSFMFGLIIAGLFRLMCNAWIGASNRFRDICKAESLIFEYRKNREMFLRWLECNGGGKKT